jgi:hypothetical protein
VRAERHLDGLHGSDLKLRAGRRLLCQSGEARQEGNQTGAKEHSDLVSMIAYGRA